MVNRPMCLGTPLVPPLYLDSLEVEMCQEYHSCAASMICQIGSGLLPSLLLPLMIEYTQTSVNKPICRVDVAQSILADRTGTNRQNDDTLLLTQQGS